MQTKTVLLTGLLALASRALCAPVGTHHGASATTAGRNACAPSHSRPSAASNACRPDSRPSAPRVSEEKVDTSLTLETVTVSARFHPDATTPVGLTVVTPADLRLRPAASNYLDALPPSPSLYSSSTGGTHADATLNLRGFKQDNIAILLNGIPIQGLTSGSMYWSNWLGLLDATYAIELQRGPGASMLTDCAMGGAVNIVTREASTASAGRETCAPSHDRPCAASNACRDTAAPPVTKAPVLAASAASVSATTDGLFRATASLSAATGPWAVTALLSATTGHGFVERSDVATLSYFLNIARALGTRHTLSLTALGSPEHHDQRTTMLSQEEIETHGREYSKNWGYLRGTPYSIARNHYFKPYFTLQHLYTAPRLRLRSAVYLALADGGGRSTATQRGARSVASFTTPDGHIDFDAILADNANGPSQAIVTDFLSGHTQLGALTTATIPLSQAWSLKAGAQYQWYSTWQRMEVLDLLGGTSWHDDTTGSDVGVGDLTGSRYGRQTHHASGFAQALLSTGALNANLGAAIFHGTYRRRDDVTGAVSPWTSATGFSLRSGAIIALRPLHGSLYANLSYSSRLPYANTLLASSNLSLTNAPRNERNLLAELGYKAQWPGGHATLSAYLASWRDKTLTVSLARRADEQAEKYQVQGLNALHKGLELTVVHDILPALTATLTASHASWLWKSDGQATIYDEYTGQTLATYTIACDGVHVGDAPQTQLALRLTAHLPHGFHADAQWRYNARFYADFEPSSRLVTGGAGLLTCDDSNRRSGDLRPQSPDACSLPAWHDVALTLGWRGTVAGIALDALVSVTNLLDTRHWERATDGADHTAAALRGFYAAPRAAAFTLRAAF